MGTDDDNVGLCETERNIERTRDTDALEKEKNRVE